MSDLCCACGKDIKDKNPACVWCLFYDSLRADYSSDANTQPRPALVSSTEEERRSARLQARKTSIT
jgi:hypothetical protein